jgi:hypothetical protein
MQHKLRDSLPTGFQVACAFTHGCSDSVTGSGPAHHTRGQGLQKRLTITKLQKESALSSLCGTFHPPSTWHDSNMPIWHALGISGFLPRPSTQYLTPPPSPPPPSRIPTLVAMCIVNKVHYRRCMHYELFPLERCAYFLHNPPCTLAITQKLYVCGYCTRCELAG